MEDAVILKFYGIKIGENIDPVYSCGGWKVSLGGITPPLDWGTAEGLMRDYPGAWEIYTPVEVEVDEKPEDDIADTDKAQKAVNPEPDKVSFNTTIEAEESNEDDVIVFRKCKSTAPKTQIPDVRDLERKTKRSLKKLLYEIDREREKTTVLPSKATKQDYILALLALRKE